MHVPAKNKKSLVGAATVTLNLVQHQTQAAVCSLNWENLNIIMIIIGIFVKRHKVVTSEALEPVGCVC